MTKETAFRKLKHDMESGEVRDGMVIPSKYTFEELAWLYYGGVIYRAGTQFRAALDVTGDFTKAELRRGSLFPKTEANRMIQGVKDDLS